MEVDSPFFFLFLVCLFFVRRKCHSIVSGEAYCSPCLLTGHCDLQCARLMPGAGHNNPDYLVMEWSGMEDTLWLRGPVSQALLLTPMFTVSVFPIFERLMYSSFIIAVVVLLLLLLSLGLFSSSYG